MTTPTLREAAQMALDALVAMQGSARGMNCGLRICDEAIEAIRAHIAQPQAEPVAYIAHTGQSRNLCWHNPGGEKTPLYASPAAPAPKLPTVPANSQEWKGMDGTIAWHLIERHADNWSDIGLMMNEWLAANAAPAPAVPRWISVADKMPDSGVTVLACYTNMAGNVRRIRACWIAAKTSESNPDSDIGEYDEATDTYYDPEGWYECIDNWDEYASIVVNEGEITHWMPLPPAPGEKA